MFQTESSSRFKVFGIFCRRSVEAITFLRTKLLYHFRFLWHSDNWVAPKGDVQNATLYWLALVFGWRPPGKGKGGDVHTRFSHAQLDAIGVPFGGLVYLLFHLGSFFWIHGPQTALLTRLGGRDGRLHFGEAFVQGEVVPHGVLKVNKENKLRTD